MMERSSAGSASALTFNRISWSRGGRCIQCAFDYGVGIRSGERGFQIAGIALCEELQVDDVRDRRGEAIEQRTDQHGGGDRGLGRGGHTRIQPGERRFGRGVARVVQGQRADAHRMGTG